MPATSLLWVLFRNSCAMTMICIVLGSLGQGGQQWAMQVSEDHCWISLGAGREEAVEVTTDRAAKRGLAPSAEAWAGWLYNGGHAVLCSPQARSRPLPS